MVMFRCFRSANFSGRDDDSVLRRSKERHVPDSFQSIEVTYLLSGLKGALQRGIREKKGYLCWVYS